MIVAPTITRLKSEVDALGGRVLGGAEYLAVIKSGNLPQAEVFAYVLYGGVAAQGQPTLSTGSYKHAVGRRATVALIIRTNDPAGTKAVDDLEEMVEAIFAALCGWRPGSEVGVFTLTNVNVAGLDKNLLITQLDFTIEDQLKVHS